jgi:hypothetical protein
VWEPTNADLTGAWWRLREHNVFRIGVIGLRVGGCEGEALIIIVDLDQREWRRLLLLNGHHITGHHVFGVVGVVEDLDVVIGISVVIGGGGSVDEEVMDRQLVDLLLGEVDVRFGVDLVGGDDSVDGEAVDRHLIDFLLRNGGIDWYGFEDGDRLPTYITQLGDEL